MATNSNDDYWDSPGAKAAEAANNADSADDYWNSAGVQDAIKQSSELAGELESWRFKVKILQDLYNEYHDDFQKEAIQDYQEKISGIQDQLTMLGYYMGDEIPDDYKNLKKIISAHKGFKWTTLIEPREFDGEIEPSRFMQKCLITWYYDQHWEAWCVPWDVLTVQEVLNQF